MNSLHKIRVTLSTLTIPKPDRESDKGAGFVEYGALIIFVGVVAALLLSSGVADTIVQGIDSAIRDALGGGSGESGGGWWPFSD